MSRVQCVMLLMYFIPTILFSQKKDPEIIILSDLVGDSIDTQEQKHYGLFPAIKGFKSAVIIRTTETQYELKITYDEAGTGEERIKTLPLTELRISQLRQQIETTDLALPDSSVVKRAFYVELGGNGLLYTLNYEPQLSDRLRLRCGIEIFPGGFALPLMVNLLLNEGDHKIEIGAGLLLVTGVWGAGGVGGTATIGYRYQSRKRGTVFRIGLTPLIDHKGGVTLWAGISLGKSY